jgi:hypothetical protein
MFASEEVFPENLFICILLKGLVFCPQIHCFGDLLGGWVHTCERKRTTCHTCEEKVQLYVCKKKKVQTTYVNKSIQFTHVTDQYSRTCGRT